MLPEADLEFLTRVPVFAGLSAAQMARIGGLARRVEFDGPSLIFGEGEPARELVVVMAGELEVRKRGRSGADMRIATLRPGDVAGEMALIDIQPRSATIRALGPASLAIITNSDLAALYREDGGAYTLLILNIAREISRRLRRVDTLLADLLIQVQDVWAGAIDATQGSRPS